MKPIRILLVIFALFNGCTSKQETTQSYSAVDSVFIFTVFLNYDEGSKTFGYVDEPTVFDFWNENREKAIHNFKIAAEMRSVPAAQRMIFASYLNEIKVDQPVINILSGLKSEEEITDVYYVMDSYGISFRKFGVAEAAVKKYCPDLVYN